MFKNDERKAAVIKFEIAKEEYHNNVNNIVKRIETVYEAKNECKKLLKKAYTFFEKISNRPYELKQQSEEIKLYYEMFEKEVNEVIQMNMKAPNGKVVVGSMAAGTTVATLGSTVGTLGPTVATLGPTVASLSPTTMVGIATTFGTASTGVAISTLSGATASNAALALIGGSSLATGGSCMALGTTFLRFAGPVGWGIASVAGIAGTYWTRRKNTEVIEAAKNYTEQIRSENEVVLQRTEKVEGMFNNLNHLRETAEQELANLINNGLIKNYYEYLESEKIELIKAHNIYKALGAAINEKIDEDTNDEKNSSVNNIDYNHVISCKQIMEDRKESLVKTDNSSNRSKR